MKYSVNTYRPNEIPTDRISGKLNEIRNFLDQKVIKQAIESSSFRAVEFKETPQFETVRDYYMALDETGRTLSEQTTNDRSNWLLGDVTEVLSILALLYRGESRVYDPKNEVMGSYEYHPSETRIAGMSIHYAVMVRNTMQRVSETLSKYDSCVGIQDGLHLVVTFDGNPDIASGNTGWTNGYTDQYINEFFSQHQDDVPRRSHRAMTRAVQWSHADLHQSASRIADAKMPDNIKELANVCRITITSQVGGAPQIRDGLRPVLFDEPHDYQLTRGFGPTEGRPTISFDKKTRSQITKAAGQIKQMILEGPRMYLGEPTT